jgi:hypothetical protein
MERVFVFAFGFIAVAGLLAASLNGLVDAFRSRKDDEIEGARYSSLRGYLQRNTDEPPAAEVTGGSAGHVGLGGVHS